MKFNQGIAFEILNTCLHIEDSDFALEDGLLPKNFTKGKIIQHFHLLAEHAGLSKGQRDDVLDKLLSNSERVVKLINAS